VTSTRVCQSYMARGPAARCRAPIKHEENIYTLSKMKKFVKSGTASSSSPKNVPHQARHQRRCLIKFVTKKGASSNLPPKRVPHQIPHRRRYLIRAYSESVCHTRTKEKNKGVFHDSNVLTQAAQQLHNTRVPPLHGSAGSDCDRKTPAQPSTIGVGSAPTPQDLICFDVFPLPSANMHRGT